ncbi:MAG: peroxiredoxin [Candidatus Thermoplasmatota archaeon]|nr:peroxiredoxin [Candidatus Thermoplasmatota archaeon]
MADKDVLEGERAPSFCLLDQEGKEVCSDDLLGKWTVLYFYPKDNTPGCTVEAKDFSCAVEDFAKMDARIVGISPDDRQSHLRFIGRHELRVTLLSDPDHAVLERFGAWKHKKLYGNSFLGVDRSTYLLDPDGVVRKVWKKVKVKGHVDEVLAELKRL